MPASAFALVGLFAAASVATGVGAWRLVGPRRAWAAPAPVLASFVALYLVGHRLGMSLGPTTRVFGYDVALAWDLSVGLGAAVGTALVQRGLVRLAERRT